jgi:hypothetical protein
MGCANTWIRDNAHGDSSVIYAFLKDPLAVERRALPAFCALDTGAQQSDWNVRSC